MARNSSVPASGLASALGIAAATLTLSGSSPAFAQAVPSAFVQEILIKTSLLTFNDANTTGNYEVLHARIAKPFADQFSTEKLAAAFKPFHDQHVYLDLIAPKPPVPTEEAKIDNGTLKLKGYFESSPNRVYYNLSYILVGDAWQLVGLNVDLKK